MFLANSLKEKLKLSYLESAPDTNEGAKFPYVQPPKDPRVLVSFQDNFQNEISPNLTTQKLQALDKKEWEETFSLKNLRNSWKRKVEIDFEDKHKKFSDEMMLPKVVESRKYVHDLRDPDILELKQKRWNISSDVHSKDRPELKKTTFEVSHGLKDFKVVPLKEKYVPEGVDSRNAREVDNKVWNISSLLEQFEKKEMSKSILQKSQENSLRYWKDNEFNRFNELAFPVDEDRKKVEIIRYFKKYRNPFQKYNDYYNIMNKVKEQTELEREKAEKKVRYKNPGERYQERINALVFKEMYNTYKYKYNELTGKIDKEEIKKKQIEENKFHWKDSDLINKIVAVQNMENTDWFKPNYSKERISRSSEKLKREILKPLVIKGNDIFIEEEKIKEKLEEEEKKNQKRELLLKQKMFTRRSYAPEFKSKYPIKKIEYDKLTKTNKLNKSDILENSSSFNQNESSQCGPHFLEAFKKVAEKEVNKQNKIFKKNKDNIEYIYSHPGTYREFEFVDFETKKDSPDSPEYIAKKNNKTMFWSCCMNEDKDSKGCQKTVVKKFSWLYD